MIANVQGRAKIPSAISFSHSRYQSSSINNGVSSIQLINNGIPTRAILKLTRIGPLLQEFVNATILYSTWNIPMDPHPFYVFLMRTTVGILIYLSKRKFNSSFPPLEKLRVRELLSFVTPFWNSRANFTEAVRRDF